MRQKQTKHTPDQLPFNPDPTHARNHSALTGGSSILTPDRNNQNPLTAQDGSHAVAHELQDHAMVYDSDITPPVVHKIPIQLRTSVPPQDAPHPNHSDFSTQLINANMDLFDHHALECFKTADERPPINLESLAELDMSRILNNPKLRHDVNFDRDLHFRPNLDGSKGKQKLQQAEEYWAALEVEFVMYQLAHQNQNVTTEEARLLTRSSFPQRLPKVFAAIRDILKTLVPDYDQTMVTDRLDVNHIMEQIQLGVCDLIDLSNWLAKVLKNHCAPMRDGLVDEMRREIQSGALEGNLPKLVSGLRQLMKILETMKLDVANHQIKHMRPLLIDDTVNFQRRYNAHRICVGKVNATESRIWLQEAAEDLLLNGADASSPVDVLISALMRDLLDDQGSLGPPTFYLDADRLRGLRGELRTYIYHAICADILKQMVGSRLRPHELVRAFGILHDAVAAIVGVHGCFHDYLDNIAVEIVRVVLMAEGHQHMAYDADLLAFAERKLGEELHPFSHTFRECAPALHERLVPKIQAKVKECLNMKALVLQDRLLHDTTRRPIILGPGAIYDPMVGIRAADVDSDDHIVRRFTHMIVLHWQVWAEMVYLVKDETELPNLETSNGGPGGSGGRSLASSASTTPTIPVAEAIYAPGRKWLPVSVTVTDVPDIHSSTPPPTPKQSESGSKAGSSEQQGEERASSPSLDSEQQQQRA